MARKLYDGRSSVSNNGWLAVIYSMSRYPEAYGKVPCRLGRRG